MKLFRVRLKSGRGKANRELHGWSAVAFVIIGPTSLFISVIGLLVLSGHRGILLRFICLTLICLSAFGLRVLKSQYTRETSGVGGIYIDEIVVEFLVYAAMLVFIVGCVLDLFEVRINW
jgi:NADH:ubiquinone oxidoreductase subunit 2 (subunit N)